MGYFYLLAVVNNDAINVSIQISVLMSFSIGHMVVLSLAI